jgi:dihydropyrimidine dehydrogenase (NAD+) subunit PreA
MLSKGFKTIEDFRGLSLSKVTDWKHLNLNFKIVARIDEQKCIGCDLCHIACWDGAHQCIHLDRVSGPVDGHVELHSIPASYEAQSRASIVNTPVTRKEREALAETQGPYPTPLARIPRVDETECVGCNLCSLVCPVDRCITMVEVDRGLKAETWEERTWGATHAVGPEGI